MRGGLADAEVPDGPAARSAGRRRHRSAGSAAARFVAAAPLRRLTSAQVAGTNAFGAPSEVECKNWRWNASAGIGLPK